jgi:hypothetical protein
MPKRSSITPEEIESLRKLAADLAAGTLKIEGKNPIAVALGRKGGLKGGAARALALTKSQRSNIAKRAALARWGKEK